MTVRDFCNEKGNDPIVNIFCNPTGDKEALQILLDYFLPEDWVSPNPIHPSQIRTEQLYDILIHNESYRFKQYPWYKKLWLKIYCFFTNDQIWMYY